MNNFETDYPMLISFYEQIAEYDNLIIDITQNGGGEDLYWMNNIVQPNIDQKINFNNYALAKSTGIYKAMANNSRHNRNSEVYTQVSGMSDISDEVLTELDLAFKTPWMVQATGSSKLYNGKIYVLIGSKVFSASEGLASFCKDTGFATLVGSNTGGEGGGYLAIKEFALPHTGLVYRFSTYYLLNSDGSSNTEYGTKPDIFSTDQKSALETCLDIIQASP